MREIVIGIKNQEKMPTFPSFSKWLLIQQFTNRNYMNFLFYNLFVRRRHGE